MRAESDADRDHGYLFIVTYGRSGSTLLQGILNSIPGYVIRGENVNYVRALYRAHRDALYHKRHKAGVAQRGPASAWFGIDGYDADLAVDRFRGLVVDALLRPPPGTRVIGFKEVRYTQPDVKAYVRFIARTFPGARFIVNTRDLDEVARSKWWAKDGESAAKLAEIDQRLRDLAVELGTDAYHLHYNDYVTAPERLRGLFEWLGEDFDEATVKVVMSEKHSY